MTVQRAVERMQGVVSGKVGINWSELVAHKQTIIDPLPGNIAVS